MRIAAQSRKFQNLTRFHLSDHRAIAAMTLGLTFTSLLMFFAWPLSAQNSEAVPVDKEPHHRLILQNGSVKFFSAELAFHDSFQTHRHDADSLTIVLEPSTTVSASAGQPDILTISKAGDVILGRAGEVHSLRNIGQTPYRIVLIELIHPQTGASNICGTQISNLKGECRVIRMDDSNPARSEQAQFATDQILVTTIRIAPHQAASFGEASRDELVIAVDDAILAVNAKGKEADQPLGAGNPVWIARGGKRRTLKNNSSKELDVVTVSFKP